ncbi:MAG: ATP-binding protein [Myxococcota bacterium]
MNHEKPKITVDDDPCRSQELGALTLQRLRDAVLWVDVEGHLRRINEAAVERFGYTKQELTSMRIFELFPSILESEWSQTWVCLREQGTDVLETQVQARNGSAVPVEAHREYLPFCGMGLLVVIVRDLRPLLEAQSALKTAHDQLEQRVLERTQALQKANEKLTREIRRRTEAAEELRISEQRYRHLYNRIPVMTFSVDSEGCIDSVSDYWLTVMGYPRDEVIGQPAISFVASSCEPFVSSELIPRLREDGIHEGVEVKWVKRDGEEIDVWLTANRDGNHKLVMGIDVTERNAFVRELRKAKETAEAGSRTKSEFLANVSHELRTPLHGILGYAQILKRDAGLEGKDLEGVEVIQRSGEHLLTLIDDVLDLSKIEAGRMDLERAAFDLHELLRDVCDLTRVRAERHGLHFVQDTCFDDGPHAVPQIVCGDGTKLRQVLINLLGNAVKFTCHGEVRLWARQQEPNIVRIEVRDTGLGIEESQIAAIFEPFAQVRTGRRQIEGSGLGLAICKRLVTLMNGALGVQSVLGEGSTFHLELSLPLVSQELSVKEAIPRRPAGYRGPRRTLLVADDNPHNRALLEGLLRPLDFRILEAADSKETLEVAMRAFPDAILIDLVMPEMDGLEAIRRMRAQPSLSRTPIIALSASVSKDNRNRSAVAGADDFLSKPIQADELLRTLGEQLSLHWICPMQTANDSDSSSPQSNPWLVPSSETLLPLLASARQGKIVAVRKQIEAIESLGPDYRAFAQELRRLSKDFRLNAIGDLIESRIENTSGMNTI